MEYKFDFRSDRRGIHSIDNFLTDMIMGHEIEFFFDGDCFFVDQDEEYNIEHKNLALSERHYLLQRCEDFNGTHDEIIFSGTYEEILDYELKDGLTLRNNFDKFSVHLIF